MTDKLYRRADGAAESPEGLLAVIPTKGRRIDDENSVFSFKSDPYGASIKVQWKTEVGIALLPADIAAAMVRFNYATGLSKAQVDAWNKAVDKENDAAEKQVEIDAKKKADDEAAAAKAAETAGKATVGQTGNIFEQQTGTDAATGGDSAVAAATDAKPLDDAAKGGDNAAAKTTAKDAEATKKAAPPLRS